MKETFASHLRPLISFEGRLVKIFSLDKARRRRQYRVYGKPPQRRIAEKDYHEALRTPGISPL